MVGGGGGFGPGGNMHKRGSTFYWNGCLNTALELKCWATGGAKVLSLLSSQVPLNPSVAIYSSLHLNKHLRTSTANPSPKLYSASNMYIDVAKRSFLTSDSIAGKSRFFIDNFNCFIQLHYYPTHSHLNAEVAQC